MPFVVLTNSLSNFLVYDASLNETQILGKTCKAAAAVVEHALRYSTSIPFLK